MNKRYCFRKPYSLNPGVMQWVNAFASCAIEGNEWAIEMIDLWDADEQDEFVKRLEDTWYGQESLEKLAKKIIYAERRRGCI